MKIDGNDPLHLLETYLLGTQRSQEGAQGKNQVPQDRPISDRVDISSRAADYQKLSQLVASTPELRLEHIAEIKRTIETGNYDVNGERIAENMVRSALIDHLL